MNRIRNINRLADNEIQNRNEINELERIREMRNAFIGIRELLNNLLSNNSQLNNDTKASENPYEANFYIQHKTRNIIIENNQEYSIETNIKNNILNKENKKPNAISLDEININISNTEKNEINNNNI